MLDNCVTFMFVRAGQFKLECLGLDGWLVQGQGVANG